MRLVLAKHGECLSLCLLLDLIAFLFCSIVLLPRLVFLRKAISSDDWNISLNLGLTCKMCQCFSTIDLILIQVRLYVIEIGILRFTYCEVLFRRRSVKACQYCEEGCTDLCEEGCTVFERKQFWQQQVSCTVLFEVLIVTINEY